jgi:hypothetical protein
LAVIMLAVGVGLAFGWRYSGLEQWAYSPAGSTAQAAQGVQGAATPESELSRVGREVDALKKRISELAAANQQLTANIAALQAGQQDLRQRTPNVLANGWHAQAEIMRYSMVAQPKGATSLPKPRPAARTEARSAPRPAPQAPLQLSAPRP